MNSSPTHPRRLHLDPDMLANPSTISPSPSPPSPSSPSIAQPFSPHIPLSSSKSSDPSETSSPTCSTSSTPSCTSLPSAEASSVPMLNPEIARRLIEGQNLASSASPRLSPKVEIVPTRRLGPAEGSQLRRTGVEVTPATQRKAALDFLIREMRALEVDSRLKLQLQAQVDELQTELRRARGLAEMYCRRISMLEAELIRERRERLTASPQSDEYTRMHSNTPAHAPTHTPDKTIHSSCDSAANSTMPSPADGATFAATRLPTPSPTKQLVPCADQHAATTRGFATSLADAAAKLPAMSESPPLSVDCGEDTSFAPSGTVKPTSQVGQSLLASDDVSDGHSDANSRANADSHTAPSTKAPVSDGTSVTRASPSAEAEPLEMILTFL
mmetsp:Transcript_29288/g.64160  ORF Transcript_29288/g.64160 Transcript_29288/m.64160 type:complete len:386 (-) Transcript_29288:710-1867(-)